MEPYLVRVSSSNPFSVSTLMHMDDYFITSTRFSGIEMKCCAELTEAAGRRPRKVQARTGRFQQPTNNLASAIRSRQNGVPLKFETLFEFVDPTEFEALKAHLVNFIHAIIKFDDAGFHSKWLISQESPANSPPLPFAAFTRKGHETRDCHGPTAVHCSNQTKHVGHQYLC